MVSNVNPLANHPLNPGQGVSSSNPENNHIWNNITSKTMGLFNNVQGRWNANTEKEKRYLQAALAVVAIVALIFAFLMLLFGFNNAAEVLPALVPLAFVATWLMVPYAQSKQAKKVATPQELAKLEEMRKRLEEDAKATNQRNDEERMKYYAPQRTF